VVGLGSLVTWLGTVVVMIVIVGFFYKMSMNEGYRVTVIVEIMGVK